MVSWTVIPTRTYFSLETKVRRLLRDVQTSGSNDSISIPGLSSLMADIDYTLTFILKHVRATNEKRGTGGLVRIFRVETRSNLFEKEKKGREREHSRDGCCLKIWYILSRFICNIYSKFLSFQRLFFIFIFHRTRLIFFFFREKGLFFDITNVCLMEVWQTSLKWWHFFLPFSL